MLLHTISHIHLNTANNSKLSTASRVHMLVLPLEPPATPAASVVLLQNVRSSSAAGSAMICKCDDEGAVDCGQRQR